MDEAPTVAELTETGFKETRRNSRGKVTELRLNELGRAKENDRMYPVLLKISSGFRIIRDELIGARAIEAEELTNERNERVRAVEFGWPKHETGGQSGAPSALTNAAPLVTLPAPTLSVMS